MDEITIEDLRQYKAIEAAIKVLEDEINALYFPVSSAPIMSDGAGRSSTPSDPTAQAFREIEKRRERLIEKRTELVTRRNRIEDWLDTVDDQYVVAIVRYHFFLGHSWRRTCIKIYGYPDSDVCRKTVKRYFDRRKKDERD